MLSAFIFVVKGSWAYIFNYLPYYGKIHDQGGFARGSGEARDWTPWGSHRKQMNGRVTLKYQPPFYGKWEDDGGFKGESGEAQDGAPKGSNQNEMNRHMTLKYPRQGARVGLAYVGHWCRWLHALLGKAKAESQLGPAAKRSLVCIPSQVKTVLCSASFPLLLPVSLKAIQIEV